MASFYTASIELNQLELTRDVDNYFAEYQHLDRSSPTLNPEC